MQIEVRMRTAVVFRTIEQSATAWMDGGCVRVDMDCAENFASAKPLFAVQLTGGQYAQFTYGPGKVMVQIDE